jgi:hypothetical protein
VRSITVLLDTRCGPCRRLGAWLGAQPAHVPIESLCARTPEANRRLPGLVPLDAAHVPVTAVDDEGRVWRGDGALRTCLWALRAWRGRQSEPRAARDARREHGAARAALAAPARRRDAAPPRGPPRGRPRLLETPAASSPSLRVLLALVVGLTLPFALLVAALVVVLVLDRVGPIAFFAGVSVLPLCFRLLARARRPR